MRLKDYLDETETTQEAFAKAIGVTQGRVSQLTKGRLSSLRRAADLIARIEGATDNRVTAADFLAPDEASGGTAP